MSSDLQFMERALDLAQRAPVTAVAPNPRVGAVVVKQGKVIGEGYHAKFGGSHAEVVALSRCRVSPEGATLYVTLEPCCHWGKTPPCTDAVINAGIKRVVCAIEDPNPLMRGKGIKVLRKRGIKVEAGTMKKEVEQLNEAFFFYQKNGLPFVAVKVATSLDGRIATRIGDSKWITTEGTRKYAREKIRSEYQAVLVGVNTVLRDSPHLGLRKKGVPDPIRIILDSELKMPLKARVLRDESVIVCVGHKVSSHKVIELERRGVKVWRFPGRRIPIKLLLKRMAREGISSVLVEGGGEVIGSFIDAGAVNKVYWFHAPLIIGGREAVPSVGGIGVSTLFRAIQLKRVQYTYVDRDVLTMGYV